ncbi:rCG44854 [Rattus norvegicus]|uniref:RCG44854 n=1 Tax=Rattus norvegicus TaxID=10116 RepID=A6I5N7_RAT|nr:rCG44854 [Rattus norvegicus]
MTWGPGLRETKQVSLSCAVFAKLWE